MNILPASYPQFNITLRGRVKVEAVSKTGQFKKVQAGLVSYM